MSISESYIFKLASILAKSFKEKLTQEESQILESWLNTSEKNRRLYLRMKEESWFEDKLRDALLIDIKKDYTEFIDRIGKNRKKQIRKTIFRYAAMVTLLLSAGSILWYLKDPGQPVPVIAENNIPAGKGEATLTLGNGEQVVLQNIDSVSARKQSGTILNITGKVLSYQQVTDSAPRIIEYNTLSVPRGGEYYLTLADGTNIWLNSESRLRYPVVFSGEKREVYLEGEAFFEVAKNEKFPFVIVAGESKTEVLGTEFNLRAYPEEAVISTTLVTGSVRLSNSENQQIILLPGEQGNVVKANGLISKHPVDTYLYTAWKDGRLVFRNCRMEDLLNVFTRWYDVEVFFQNAKIKDIRFTGDMCKTEHIDALLKIIESNELIVFERHERTLIVKTK